VKHLAVTWVGLRADRRGELGYVVILVGRKWLGGKRHGVIGG
jgi:hypothetical protein